MTLQRKFVLIVGMLGIALLGNLAAAWWAFGILQREISTPFGLTAEVLDTLGQVKRNTEEQARIINAQGALPADHAEAAPGVRGPWAKPQPFQPSAEVVRQFRAYGAGSAELLQEIELNEALRARWGHSDL